MLDTAIQKWWHAQRSRDRLPQQFTFGGSCRSRDDAFRRAPASAPGANTFETVNG